MDDRRGRLSPQNHFTRFNPNSRVGQQNARKGGSINERQQARHLPLRAVSSARWDLAFLGTLGYLFVEYTRLAAMFPVLEPLQPGKIAVGAGALGLIIAPRRNRPSGAPSKAADIVLFFFFVASVLSACFAEYQSFAWGQVVGTLQWCVIYLLISRSVTSSWRLRLFVLFYLLLNLKLAQFGVRSYFADITYGRSAEFIAAHGEGAGSTGFFGNQGDFGVAMCVVWPLAGCLLIGEKRLTKYFLLACFLAFLGAIVVSGSRGAVLSAGMIAFAGVLKSQKRVAGLLMLLFFALVVVCIMPQASKARLQSALHPGHDETASIRLNLWRAGLNMFEDHPILGVGPANFPPEYLNYHPPSDRRPKMWVPHSIYIEGLSELGIVGFIPLLAIFVLIPALNARTRWKLQRSGPEASRSFEYRLSVGLDLALLGYMVSGAFITVLYYPHLWVLLGLTAALHASCSSASKAAEPTVREGEQRIEFSPRRR